MPPASDPLGVTLDLDIIEAFRAASPETADFLISLIDLYLAEAAGHIAQIAHAAARGDVVRLQSAAHSLKGSSLVMGAARLAALCGRIESRLIENAAAAVAAEDTAGLDEEFARVRAALDLERHP